MDGVDIVAASFNPLTLHATLTVPFDPELRDELMALTLPDDNEIDRMGKADVALAQMIGHGINELIKQNNLDRNQIKAIIRGIQNNLRIDPVGHVKPSGQTYP